ncbi:MAG: transposase, partial [Janthinobacterium lividum]
EQYGKAYARQQSKRGRQMKKLRQSTVEPIFGSLTQYYGLNKIGVLGKAGAHKVMLLAAVAFNLKKYLKTEGRKPSCACFKDGIRELEQALFGLIAFLTNPVQFSLKLKNYI